MLQCVILAGGLGTRMRAHDATVPKCLIPVADRPFADWQLAWLKSEGVDRVLYSIGYRGQLVRDHIGDGSAWSLHVSYVDEGDHLLGTGGALRLALEKGLLDDTFFVLYGDSYLSVDLLSVEAAYRRSELSALMTVFRNKGRWEKSNVVFDGRRVTRYDKSGGNVSDEMQFVDYGLSVLRRDLIADTVPSGIASDLAAVLQRLSLSGDLAGYEVTERFYEVGSIQGLRALEDHLRKP